MTSRFSNGSVAVQNPPPADNGRARERFTPSPAQPAVKVHRRLDELMVDGSYIAAIDLLTWLRSWYYMARSFLIHHRWGRVSHETYFKRRKHCLDCNYRQLVEGDDGQVREFCRDDNCGCGTKPNPVTGRAPDIAYKASLVNWECPLPGTRRKFGRGRAVRDPELESVRLDTENDNGG